MKAAQIVLSAGAATIQAANCSESYLTYASVPHPPYSSGKYELPYMRPAQDCRTYRVDEVEEVIEKQQEVIKDPDLYQVFRNTWPNTVDTTISWHGHSADDEDEELAFIVTGDINAMWLRDSANQLQSYKPILHSSGSSRTEKNDIATLFRGGINLQARYIRQSPYCNAFQPPVESGLEPQRTEQEDVVRPEYNPDFVFECKYELDSLAAFLQLSWDYYDATGDAVFFAKHHWKDTVETILDVAKSMRQGTYDAEGSVLKSPYNWLRRSDRATESVPNNGEGDPIRGDIGLIRSFFRGSDDSCTFQYLIPSNMMFSSYLDKTAAIMSSIDKGLAREMKHMADGVHRGIEKHAVIEHPEFGRIYAYEVNGFGGANLMDDANIPSLLSAPHLGYKVNPKVYANTRKFVLSRSNPYYAYGPVIKAVGGPHLGPGMGWPMAVLAQIMTSESDGEIVAALKQLLGSTSGLGLMHETVNSHNDTIWTRPWFSWTNGLFGQMILDLGQRRPHLLRRSYQ